MSRSIYGYTSFERKAESYTSDYAYFKRDHRRQFPPTVAVKSCDYSKLLPVPDLIIQNEQSSSVVEPPPVPGKRRVYSKSQEQPPQSGYFPVINCD